MVIESRSIEAGYAYHKILCDKKGVPVDYIFLDVNTGFERLTGLKKEMVIGQRVTQVLPGIINPDFDWIKTFGKVALKGKSVQFEQYFKPLGRWFSISAFSVKEGYFRTLFLDSTSFKGEVERVQRLASFFKEQSSLHLEDLEGRRILKELLKLTGAKYGLFITFHKEREKVLIQSMAGKPNRLKKINKIFQYTLEGMEFPLLEEKIESLKEKGQIEYSNLYDFGYGFVPMSVASILKDTLNVKKCYSIAIPYRGEPVGEFCLAFTPKRKMPYPYLVDLFAHQVGLLLKGEREEREYGEVYRKYRDVLHSSSNSLCLLHNGRFVSVNSSFSKLTGYSEEQLCQMSLLDLLLEEKRERLRSVLQKRLEKEHSRREYPMVRENGDVFYLLLHTIRLGGGYSLGFGLDVTLHSKIPEEYYRFKNSS